jgi:LysM repeat protein
MTVAKVKAGVRDELNYTGQAMSLPRGRLFWGRVIGVSLWQKCTIVLLGVAIFGGAAYFARIVSQPPELERYKSIPWVTYVHPNIKKLKQAQELVGQGKLNDAQAVVVKALLTAPKSPVTRELRDLLGNINTQLFFSKEPSPRKTEYTVKQGDTLSLIARKFDSSAEAIVRVNNLDSILIRPGEKLFVPRLDFNITIDLPSNRVIMHDNLGFFCQYPIESAKLPPSRKPIIETKVKAKSYWKNDAPTQSAHRLTKEGAPRIDLGRAGYLLYGAEEAKYASTSEIAFEADDKEGTPNSSDTNRLPRGIAMQKDDMAEIELLIRKGTPVTIILDPKFMSVSESTRK